MPANFMRDLRLHSVVLCGTVKKQRAGSGSAISYDSGVALHVAE